MARSVVAAASFAFSFVPFVVAGCFGTEVPPDPKQPNPLEDAPAPTSTSANADPARNTDARTLPPEPDKQQLAGAIKRGQRTAADCAKIHTDGPFGTAQVQLVLSPQGKIADAQLPAPFAGTAIGKCVEQAFEHELITPFAGDNKGASTTVELKAGAAPASSGAK